MALPARWQPPRVLPPLPAGPPLPASPRIGRSRSLCSRPAPARAGAVLSVDLFYDAAGRHRADRDGIVAGHDGEAEIAIEMEAATLFALGRSLGVGVACVLVVTDTFSGGEARGRLDDHRLLEAAERMGAAAVAALAAA